MNAVDQALNDLVIANRILAHEGVVDAYGHVAVRHPEKAERFFIARSLAPELVTRDDIVELQLDGAPVGGEAPALYLERFIHGAILEARPEIMATVHAHAEETLPFGIAKAMPLRPVIHSGSFIGANVPVWDIRDHFGDTDLLVRNMEQGRSLATSLAANNVALLSAHGFVAAARSVIEAVRMSVFLARNARVILHAKGLGGELRYLSDGEIAARNRGYGPYSTETWRTWEYWATKAGCAKMLYKPPT
jgi:ribulose-5-phosphate 4-epimerase/fuculose-1-phosphate aldolase